MKPAAFAFLRPVGEYNKSEVAINDSLLWHCRAQWLDCPNTRAAGDILWPMI